MGPNSRDEKRETVCIEVNLPQAQISSVLHSGPRGGVSGIGHWVKVSSGEGNRSDVRTRRSAFSLLYLESLLLHRCFAAPIRLTLGGEILYRSEI
jgi:hypothetical protein